MADPKISEGARLERRAIRDYLRREIKCEESVSWRAAFSRVLEWVLARQKRYDKAPGGLGKK